MLSSAWQVWSQHPARSAAAPGGGESARRDFAHCSLEFTGEYRLVQPVSLHDGGVPAVRLLDVSDDRSLERRAPEETVSLGGRPLGSTGPW
jgi:hypothetical protein